MSQTFSIGIGGAAGQGVATPGDIFAKIFSRRGLHLNAYNAYQSIIRGGHTFLTIRTGVDQVTNMGDAIDSSSRSIRTRWTAISACSPPAARASITPTHQARRAARLACNFALCR